MTMMMMYCLGEYSPRVMTSAVARAYGGLEDMTHWG